MNKGLEALSNIIIFNKYAKYLPELQRRETWEEIVTRNKEMHIKKFPKWKDKIDWSYQYVYDKKVLPSMRSMQFAGKPIELNNARLYNCSFLPIDHYKSFSETMFLLLSGCGVGYSVQYKHIDKLPQISKLGKKKRFVIEDSIIGWSDAVKVLLKAYLAKGQYPKFDFSDIRAKGELLKTSGGKAPGPEPLKRCLFEIEQILSQKEEGDKLTSLEVHSIMCHIADAVLSGGIRRSAMIALFSFDDESMIGCKSGNWWELNPHFARANNSAVINRDRITEEEFNQFWERIKASGAGEPGISFTNDSDYGFNPCHEVSLRPYSFCNLVEINAGNIEDENDFYNRCEAATLIATIQATYTDFTYLRDIWQENTEKDSLIGVGITGIASNKIDGMWLKRGAKIISTANHMIADSLNINPAARTTVVKPSGTTSCVLGTSSGIHSWYNDYYIRTVRVNKMESLYTYLSIYHPEMLEDEIFKPTEEAVISIPVKAPNNAITRHEGAIEFLERVKSYNQNWVAEGHVKGPNMNNVSATVNIKEDEWDQVRDWMWANRHLYTGISVIPHSEHSYKQAPFQEITRERYEELENQLSNLDLSKVVEIENNTNFKDNLACAGGQCEI